MNEEHPPHAAATQQKPEGFAKEVAREVGKDFLSQSKSMFKWVMGGGIVGALVLGACGGWFFGVAGLGLGALVGAFLGGIVGAGLNLVDPFDF